MIRAVGSEHLIQMDGLILEGQFGSQCKALQMRLLVLPKVMLQSKQEKGPQVKPKAGNPASNKAVQKSQASE